MRVDVLHRRSDGRWRLDRSQVHQPTLKEQHLDDVAIQYRVLSRCGLDVGSCCLAHVNRSYVFRGGSDRSSAFLSDPKRDAAESQRLQPKLTFQLRAAFTVLVDAQSARHRSGTALHRPRHLRVLSTAAIRRARTITSDTCQESTPARSRSLRKWASSPSTTSLTISS